MCRRAAALLAGLLLAAAAALPAHAQTGLQQLLGEGESTASATAESAQNSRTAAEILVIYPDVLTDIQRDSLRIVILTLTQLGHTADYLPQSTAPAHLAEYSAVVCFAVEQDTQLDAALARCTGQCYLLGCLPSTLSGTEPSAARQTSQSSVAQYTFSGNAAFSEALLLPQYDLPEALDYTAGTLVVGEEEGPLACGWDKVRFLPIVDYTTAFARAVLMQELTLWLWPYKDPPHSYAQFVVIDSLYPFTDPNRLLELVENLVQEKMPFVLSVMPIYENADFPAMQQFCEVLRYAQANGGAVILHAPLTQNVLDAETLQQKLTDATENYFANGVYPLALEIPESWMYDEALRTTLGRYRTLFTYEDGTAGSALDLALATNDFVRLGAQLICEAIPLDASGVGYLDCCATAVYLDVSAGADSAVQAVCAAKSSAVPLKSLWEMQHTVYLNEGGLLNWDGTALTVDGTRVSLTYEPQSCPENYDYKRTIYYRATADLAGQNQVLLWFAGAALAVFLLFICLARRQMKRRFYLPDVPGDHAEQEEKDTTDMH